MDKHTRVPYLPTAHHVHHYNSHCEVCSEAHGGEQSKTKIGLSKVEILACKRRQGGFVHVREKRVRERERERERGEGDISM